MCQIGVHSRNYGKVKGRKGENSRQRISILDLGDCLQKHGGC